MLFFIKLSFAKTVNLDVDEDRCPANVTAVVDDSKTSARVSWITPTGDTVTMTLPAGEHDFIYSSQDSSDCHFTVFIIGR